MNYVVAANMTHGPMDQIEATAIDHSAAKCMGRAEPYARGFSQSGTRQEQLHESTNHGGLSIHIQIEGKKHFIVR